MALTMAVNTSRGLLQRFAPSSAFERMWESLVYDLSPAVVGFLFFFVLYRVVPRRAVSTAHAAVGDVLATALWEAAKTAFSWYLRNLARYAGVYGTLEGVIVLAIWLELSVSIVLYCGEIVALLIPPKKPPRPAHH